VQALNVLETTRFDPSHAAKQEAVKTPELSVDALYLRPGQRHGPVRLDRDRAYLVLSGRGELVLEGEPLMRIALVPGLIALAPAGTWHAVAGGAEGDLVVAASSPFPVRVEERG